MEKIPSHYPPEKCPLKQETLFSFFRLAQIKKTGNGRCQSERCWQYWEPQMLLESRLAALRKSP